MARVSQARVLKELAALGVRTVNPDAVLDYINTHPDLVPLVTATSRKVRRELPDVPLALDLVEDPEEEGTVTLVLYLQPSDVKARIFGLLDRWNRMVAEALRASPAWFLVTVDLRGSPSRV